VNRLPVNPWLSRFQWLFVLGFAVHAGWLAWIQVFNPTLPEDKEDITEHLSLRHGRRGSILDASRVPLVLSQTVYTLRADAAILDGYGEAFAAHAAPLLGISPKELQSFFAPKREWRTNLPLVTNVNGRRITNASSGFVIVNRSVPVKPNVLPEEWDVIRAGLRGFKVPGIDDLEKDARRHPRDKQRQKALKEARGRQTQLRVLGLTADPAEMRSYPHGSLFAHGLGYVTNVEDAARHPIDDLRGAMGIERQFEGPLRGHAGALQTHRVKGRELVAERELDLDPMDGMNVVLTIDVAIQSIVERAVASAMERLTPRGMVAIVTRPKSGEILALASAPTFQPGRLHEVRTNLQLLNRAVSLPLEPGSTFKIFTYAIAFNEGLLQPDEKLDCENGRWRTRINGAATTIEDDHKAHGLVDLEEAFGQSMNTVAAKIGIRIPAATHVAYLTNFGFGTPTGIALGAEAGGRVKNPQITTGAYRWDALTQSRMSYGYALQVTPLQLVMAVGAIANDGWLMKPLLVKSIEAAGGGQPFFTGEPQAIRRVISAATAARMKHLMRQAVLEGTGGKAAVESWSVAGKTGTSRKYLPGQGYSSEHFYGSFIGMLPVEDPQLCILVLVDEPVTKDRIYYGGKSAAPIFAEIARASATYLAIKPSPTNEVTNLVMNTVAPDHGLPGRDNH
jgi:cell division protein FtsI/penicillin-binding protein 2